VKNNQIKQPQKRRALVLLDPQMATVLADRMAALEQKGAIIKVIDYQDLMRHTEQLRKTLDEHQLDFLVFSRNDQVFDKVSIGPLIRRLRAGYSSFSGIDSAQALEQTRICLDDYLTKGTRLSLPEIVQSIQAQRWQKNTFSLIFDMEQLGGARFGLPRILDLLEQYRVRATFFITNFIQEVYVDAIDLVVNRGHEVGLHGQYHEYLAGRPIDEQIEMIRQMKSGFSSAGKISGANFIYRMDASTVDALIANDLDYFVVFMEHNYKPFAYNKVPLRPMLMQSPAGTIWMVPISVETYDRPWFVIRNMIDSAHMTGCMESWPHVNILMHPFRDGSMRYIDNLERMINYLQTSLGYKGVSISTTLKRLPIYEPSNLIYFRLDSAKLKPIDTCFWRAWWHDRPRYQQRVSNLYQALSVCGRQPALCFDLPPEGVVFGIYPCLPEMDIQMNLIREDPLLFTQGYHYPFDDLIGADSQELSFYSFIPKTFRKDLFNAMRCSRPRFKQDYSGLLPEVALRVAYRLSRNRKFF
jgi:peptidoglycan/xylan/chitin deacetylase (PgdA/CDA1 family)